MGLFADTCRALIDPATKRALTGQALENARRDPQWPRCGNRVPKRSRICNRCGTGAPGGWWKCGSCGEWVGNESNYCWNCRRPLHPDTRLDIAGGVWQKDATVFAQRFEVADMQRLIAEGIQVQTGTVAILLNGGAIADLLEAGRHKIEEEKHRFQWFKNPPPHSVVLVDIGEVVIPLHLKGLHSAEQIEVDYFGEIVLKFDMQRAEPFLANLFSQRQKSQQLTFDSLALQFNGEIRGLIQDFCAQTTMENLYRDPLRRVQIEELLRQHLSGALHRAGLNLVRVSTAEFAGEKYDELVDKAGEIEIKRRQLEFDQHMRDMVTSGRMDELRNENQLEDYTKQLAQERGVTDEHRRHELNLLRQAQGHESQRIEIAERMRREMDDAAHQTGLKLKWDDYEFDRWVKKAKAEVAARQAHWEQEIRETAQALKWRKEKKDQDVQNLAQMGAVFKGLSIQAMIPLIDDPQKVQALLALNEQEAKKGASPEYILALAAEKSPAAADALARMSGRNQEDLMKLMAEYKELYKDVRDRDARLAEQALDVAREGAKHPGTSTTINK